MDVPATDVARCMVSAVLMPVRAWMEISTSSVGEDSSTAASSTGVSSSSSIRYRPFFMQAWSFVNFSGQLKQRPSALRWAISCCVSRLKRGPAGGGPLVGAGGVGGTVLVAGGGVCGAEDAGRARGRIGGLVRVGTRLVEESSSSSNSRRRSKARARAMASSSVAGCWSSTSVCSGLRRPPVKMSIWSCS